MSNFCTFVYTRFPVKTIMKYQLIEINYVKYSLACTVERLARAVKSANVRSSNSANC
uniref:Uncharacterized protein n=1 Tax=Anguilla anguilla TaxID=7936 RepID=A0A0E9U273_ANGAN